MKERLYTVPRKRAPGAAKERMDRAKGKLLVARQPLPEGGYWEDLCFMAHQAAELGIKAIYRIDDRPSAYVNDLAFLLHGLERKGVNVPPGVRDAVRPTIYATQLRHPGTSGFATTADRANALRAAEAVVAWAEGIIGGRLAVGSASLRSPCALT